ncbi:hypothetical protein [Gracilibacillus xinjiangensis]|uniref:Uncharacterized protein n=1 Tax=Gracilibacillus xinjiangensis TaxID=1193282 RepID=A0ABV8X0R9_9BACI
MAKTNIQQEADFNEHTRPHPLHIYFFPALFGIVSIAAPNESRPYSIAAGLIMAVLLIFALYVTFRKSHSKKRYNQYLSITMVFTSVLTLIPGLKISVGIFWTVFLLISWCVMYFVSFYGKDSFHLRSFRCGSL